jgi:predicted ArsR family transcriptional regulator
MTHQRPIRAWPFESLGLLGEPVRRSLYVYVTGRTEPVDRDEAAAAVGIGRPLAAFHLDRLAKVGLLDVEFRRRSGRTGPGAGRPAKFYRRSNQAIEVSVPPRRYALAARIFAKALEQSADLAAIEAVAEAAGDEGSRLGRDTRLEAEEAGRPITSEALVQVLGQVGFEPDADDAGSVRLRNCPFKDLVVDHREMSCGANLAMLTSLAGALPEARMSARREDAPGYCCVSFDSAEADGQLQAG